MFAFSRIIACRPISIAQPPPHDSLAEFYLKSTEVPGNNRVGFDDLIDYYAGGHPPGALRGLRSRSVGIPYARLKGGALGCHIPDDEPAPGAGATDPKK
jgi:hypothetical protein